MGEAVGLSENAKNASVEIRSRTSTGARTNVLDMFVDPITFHTSSANRELLARQEALPSSSSSLRETPRVNSHRLICPPSPSASFHVFSLLSISEHGPFPAGPLELSYPSCAATLSPLLCFLCSTRAPLRLRVASRPSAFISRPQLTAAFLLGIDTINTTLSVQLTARRSFWASFFFFLGRAWVTNIWA